ncbi:hypothetical protein OS493_030867 [Desmophyllum pertusum]|uniref:Uncharacterized protein n=1 Tax=Desmophyllum pertusum TaxID=174260 RepID=A0A9W9YBZ0_9CNID|nr:hypothetical protein OS493_030867 [Desmophyllum pertusum]
MPRTSTTDVPSQFLITARRDEDDFSTGFPLKEGDILEVTECKRGTETALEPDVISCYYLCESEINAFLEHMLKVLQSDGSTAAVTELIIRFMLLGITPFSFQRNNATTG